MSDPLSALRDQALDMRVLRWSDGPKGATVTLDLHPDDVSKNGGVNPFKGREGKRAKVVIWWVADDETTEPAPTTAAAAYTPAQQSRSEQAKASYRDAAPMKQAATRAALLCKDRRLWKWAKETTGFEPFSEIEAAGWMKRQLEIESRSEIATDATAYETYLRMETSFRVAVGELPSPR